MSWLKIQLYISSYIGLPSFYCVLLSKIYSYALSHHITQVTENVISVYLDDKICNKLISHAFTVHLLYIEYLTFQNLAATSCTTRLNIEKFCMVLILCLCVVYGYQNRQELLPYTALTDQFCITELGSVYCAVWTRVII